jgi:antitoxin component of RelBE/YafQ-DinJ toxin-antitoxin module|tara:strand:+ start:137 stop:358 length:222 start_codon:yes stop_codon:yes gene_type:complete
MSNNLKDLNIEMDALFDDIEYLTDEGIDIELKTIAQECGVPLETVIDQYNSQCLWIAECVDEAQAERRQMGIC